MKTLFLLIFLLLLSAGAGAQVGINADGSDPDNSAMLDVQSSNKGFLPPRVPLTGTTDGTTISSPASGLLVYNTATAGDVSPGYYYFNGTSWVRIGTAGQASQWTSGGSNIYYNTGYVGIGTTAPMHLFQAGSGASDMQSIAIRAYGNGTNWKGGAAFGYSSAAVILGELGGVAQIGGHTATLGNWANLAINAWGGNVGIGTTNPAYKLDVNGDVNVTGNFKINGTNLNAGQWIASNNDIYYNSGSVGIGTTSPNSSAVLDVSSTSKGFLPPKMTTGQRDSIAAPAAGLTIYNTTKNCIETFNGSSWAGSAHYIGESYCGGIVFFVYDNGQHGLIAAPADLNPAMPILQWDKDPTKTGATGDGINAGLMNTAISIARIIPYTPNDMFAALCCVNYSTEVDGIKYGSWYLPSKQELNLLYLQKAVVGGFSSDFYWSSTEQTYYLVWALRFSNGQWSLDEKPNWYRIRAIRAF